MKKHYLIIKNDKFSFVKADGPWTAQGSQVCESTSTTVNYRHKMEHI